MTRIEISICHAAIQEYKLQQAGMSSFFKQRMQAAMDHLVATVLNHSKTLTLAYKRLGSCKENLLVIGTSNSWIINARTATPWRLVGTRLPIGLSTSASNKSHWK